VGLHADSNAGQKSTQVRNIANETKRLGQKSGLLASGNLLIAVVWASALIASCLDVILWKELTGSVPLLLPWIHAVALTAILVFTFLLPTLRVLRGFVLILAIIFFLGLNGGWQWGLIPFIRQTSAWVNWEAQAPWALSSVSLHLLRLTPALLILGYLLLGGKKRSDFFLTKGKMTAPIEPTRLLGIKKPEPWTKTGIIFGLVFGLVTLIYLAISAHPSLSAIQQALPLIPVALLIAVINSFNEEFTLRAAPVSELWQVLGKWQALAVTSLFFGIGHYYGVPSGLLGVLLAMFLGWFLGKSMLETKGFGWAWLIHFLPDAFIFSFFAIAAIQ
jgi:membrane protease YdiL (CAAX protease family)